MVSHTCHIESASMQGVSWLPVHGVRYACYPMSCQGVPQPRITLHHVAKHPSLMPDLVQLSLEPFWTDKVGSVVWKALELGQTCGDMAEGATSQTQEQRPS